jgi:hypothetical protein
MRSADPRRWSPAPELRAEIGRLYQATADAGWRHVVLRLSPTMLRERVLSTRQHRHPEWSRFLATRGDDDDAIVAYYDRQQRLLLEACSAFAPEMAPVICDVDGEWPEVRYAHVARELAARFLDGATPPMI